MKQLFIFCPIYNEELQVETTVRTLIDYCKKNLTIYDWKVGIADNASKDKSQEICKKLEKEFGDKFKYIHLSEKGKGLALKKAWTEVDFDFSIYMDVDLATDIKHIKEAVELYEKGADLVYASRKASTSNEIGRSTKRVLTSWGYVNLVKFLSRSKISDYQCGFKGITKKLATTLMPVMESRHWFFDTELLLNSEKLKYKVVELPVIWTDDPGTTVKLFKDSNQMFMLLLGYLSNPSYLDVVDEREKEIGTKIERSFVFKKMFEIFKFIFAGGTAFLLQAVLYLFFKNVIFPGFESYFWIFRVTNYDLASGIAYGIGAIYNFIFNKLFTFEKGVEDNIYYALRFFIVVLLTILVIQPPLYRLFVEILKINSNYALIPVAIIVMFTNYLIHKYWTFK